MASHEEGGDDLRARQRALSALVAKQRQMVDELAALSDHVQSRVREIVDRARAVGLDVHYAGTLEGAMRWWPTFAARDVIKPSADG